MKLKEVDQRLWLSLVLAEVCSLWIQGKGTAVAFFSERHLSGGPTSGNSVWNVFYSYREFHEPVVPPAYKVIDHLLDHVVLSAVPRLAFFAAK